MADSGALAISREYSFSAAHRIEGHPKCGRLHGHNYRVVVWLKAPSFATYNGMLLDYGEMDRVIKPIIDELDHRYLVSETNLKANDSYAKIATTKGDACELGIAASTGELLAEYFHTEVVRALRLAMQYKGFPLTGDMHAVKVQIEVWETPKSCAAYTNDETL